MSELKSERKPGYLKESNRKRKSVSDEYQSNGYYDQLNSES